MKHSWDHDNQKRLAASEFKDGNGRNLRSCKHCSIVKVTVIPPHGRPWHEWILQGGKVWTGEATPPCAAREPEEVKAL